MKATRASRYYQPQTAKRRLLFWLLVFFIGISLPVYFLVHKVYSQLENETWYQQRQQAELLVERIEQQLLAKLQVEQDRPIAEYNFFNVVENRLLQSATVNFSPLSAIPPKSDIPGLVGYFQVDPDGSFHIPALPKFDGKLQAGLSASSLAIRMALKAKLQGLLALPSAAAANVVEQEVLRGVAEMRYKPRKDRDMAQPVLARQTNRFADYLRANEQDQVLGSQQGARVEDAKQDIIAASQKSEELSEAKLQQLNIATALWKQKQAQDKKTPPVALQKNKPHYRLQARKEVVNIPQQSSLSAFFKRNQTRSVSNDSVGLADSNGRVASVALTEKKVSSTGSSLGEQEPVSILSFESEVSPLQMITLGTQHLCFYRNAWNGKERYIQGMIVDMHFMQQIIQPIFASTYSLPLSSLLVVNDGEVLQQFKQAGKHNELLIFRRALLPPFQQMEIIVNSGSLAAGYSKQMLDLVSIVLAIVVLSGFILFYRLGAGQIELAKQQRNFISSISHELKTPLTSIRMYAEMLRADWVTDVSRKQSYYDYIYFESERLSRLISNVLQLARLDNQQKALQLTEQSVGHLLQQVQAKVAAQIEASQYQLNLLTPEHNGIDVGIKVDEDAFFQIMINLVDNAIKFSKQAEYKSIDIGYKITDRGKCLVFYVRDYGTGVEPQQMKKIFRLFYRAGDELTRTQPGTGIGLALVVQLADAMDAQVDLLNRHPGAEFQVKFKVV
ncbi:MAG: two-component system, OmpR family, phosphate regulon sensor histidine kinase PhoR [Methyloprofundus sp.]|nr:MAG: two-component system, OmpR family, phosphate regulon sensor histidine kinase PhoR [Methyloprofundus sp.]